MPTGSSCDQSNDKCHVSSGKSYANKSSKRFETSQVTIDPKNGFEEGRLESYFEGEDEFLVEGWGKPIDHNTPLDETLVGARISTRTNWYVPGRD